jgi:tellurite resistance protein
MTDDRRPKRENEEDYFRKQDLELLERMRKSAAADQARKELGDRSGLHDPELVKELEQLGFSPDTLSLLPLVPVLQVAWAEGSVSPEERKLIVDLARARGVAEGSAADGQLREWLAHRPPQNVFTRAGRLISAMIAAGSAEMHDLTADDLVKYCENIATASGGILGLGKISAEERAALSQIQGALKARNP